MNYFIVQGELDDLVEVAKSQSGPTGMVAPAVVLLVLVEVLRGSLENPFVIILSGDGDTGSPDRQSGCCGLRCSVAAIGWPHLQCSISPVNNIVARLG
jgi:hypothetical protein